jgi:hypothetical protein
MTALIPLAPHTIPCDALPRSCPDRIGGAAIDLVCLGCERSVVAMGVAAWGMNEKWRHILSVPCLGKLVVEMCVNHDARNKQ